MPMICKYVHHTHTYIYIYTHILENVDTLRNQFNISSYLGHTIAVPWLRQQISARPRQLHGIVVVTKKKRLSLQRIAGEQR
jgi:hypothetical protein